MHKVYYITGNFKRDKDALSLLISQGTTAITLSNTPAQIKFLGALLIHRSFIKLKKIFSSKVIMTTINVDYDLAALWSAIKLGYKNSETISIEHTFTSVTIKNIIAKHSNAKD